MPVSVRRVAAISAMAIAILVVAALLLVHLPPVRGRVFALVVRTLASSYDLDLRAGRLDYNLFTRRVTLTDVRLAAVGHEQEPLLTANRVSVQLPWSIFRGLLAYDRIELDTARVSMLRRADGSSNLPQFDTPADAVRPPLQLDIRTLTLRGLDFSYADEARNFYIDAGDLQTNLERPGTPLIRTAAGPLEIRRGVQIRMGERTLEAQPISGRMGFDGSALTLDNVGLATREATVVINGTILRVIDQPELQLRFDGTAELARAADWATLPIAIGGQAAVQGTIEGPAAATTITVEATSDAAQLGGVPRAGLDTRVIVTPTDIVVERGTIRDGNGLVNATARVGLGDDGATEVKAEWRDLRADTVLQLLDQTDRRLASTITGKMTLTQRAGQPIAIRVDNQSVAPSTPPRDRAPLSGTLALEARDGKWTLTQTHTLGALTIDGTIGGRITGTDLATATVDGPVTIDSADVTAAATAIEQLGVDLPAIATTIRGPVQAVATLSGMLNAPQVQAAVSSDALVLPGLASAAVKADLDISAERVDVPAFTATLAGAALSGTAAIDLRAGTLAGQFSLDAPDAGALLTSLPEAARLTGPITATVTLGGTTTTPDIRATLDGHSLAVSGQPIDAIAATTRITTDTLFVDALSVTTNGGSLTGTGSYAWAREAYTADLKGADLSWRGQLAGDAETEVRVSQLTFAGSGTVARPGGAGQVTFQLSGGPAGDIVEGGVADIRLNGDNATIDARVPSLGAQLKTTVLTATPYTFDATADIAQLDLSPLASLAGLPVGGVLGRLSMTVAARGEAARALDSTEVTANLQQVAATVGEVPIWLAAPSTVSWRKDDLRVASLELGIGTGMLTAAGRLAPGNDSQWTSAFKGQISELVQMARAVTNVPAELNAAGQLDAAWQSTGGIDRSTATLGLINGQVGWADLPPVTALTLQAGFDGAAITLSSLTGTWQEGGISGTASVPRALLDGSSGGSGASAQRGHAQVKVTGLTQASVAPWVSQAVLDRIAGRVSATLDADILGTQVKDIAGTVVLDEAKLTLADIEVQQARPTKIAIRDGRITMEDVSWTAGGGPLDLTGSVLLDAPKGTELDLALKGDLNLGLLVAFAPTTWTAGSALIDMKVTGPATDPDVQGRIDLRNGEAAVFEPRLILYDLNGTIALDRQRVRFVGVAGSLNGGSIRLDGQLGLDAEARAAAGQLIVELGQVAMEFPQGLQSEIDGLLTFGPRGEDWQLGGDLRIARSSYTDNISLPALASARRNRAPIDADAEPTFLDRLRLNLLVVTEEDLNLDNNYGRIAAGAAVRVVNTASEPALTGRVTLREGGEVFLAGRTFRVERGAISFTSPTRIEPELDIELRTLAGGVDVALTLSGTMDQLKTEVRSTSPDATDKQAQEALYGNLGGEDAATLLSAELLGVTGRAVGLDSLRLERGGTDSDDFRNDPTLIVSESNSTPTTRLTLSKRLRPDVELIISRSLQDSGGVAAAVSYKVRRNIELRASQREDTDRAIAVRHEVSFGGGASRSGSAVTVQPRVSAVRISGEPGQPEPDVLALVHLKEGDRFAFHEWQRDVDRIKESYSKRGYFEARVRPTRQVSEDGQSVELTHRVDQGPKTDVVIEGHDIHSPLREELQDAWSRAIFDRFLIDDVKVRAMRDQLREDYIGSKIDVTIVKPDAATKQLRVVITPGTHVSGRDIRFTGNEHFSQKQLVASIDAQGFDEEVWLDPAKVATALEPFYREQGYLSVKVSATAPLVEGGRAVLPVKIEESPRFAFASPVVTGVGEARRGRVDQALAGAVQAGAPYDATLVEDARRRVERLYLGQGYNNARIDIRPTSDQDASTVTMNVTVEEGLQQILREVTTAGDDRTRDGVVRRALRLRVNQPVDLGQWAQARKRLYDTNVFAQVDIEPVAIEATEQDKAAGIEPVRAMVRLAEYPEWRLRYGLQLNDQRTGDEDVITTRSRQQNLGVLADIQNRNIFGRAIAGGLAIRAERDRQIASLFGSNASFFSLPIRTQAFLFTSREQDRAFEVGESDIFYNRIGTSIEQRWQARRRTEVVYAYRYDQTRTEVPELEIDATNHTGKLTAGIILDRRDDPFSAKKGWFTAANYELAARVLGGDSRNGKLLVQQYYFYPLGRAVLASRAQIGSAFGQDRLFNDNVFFLGGATTVRGYAQDGLGPRDLAGLPAGQALLSFNQEVRFPVKGWVNGVGFIDAGNTFNTRGDLAFGDLKVGYGIGLRLDTPFAMLRVDFGIPGSTLPGSTRQANSFRNGRWYIGIGHIF